MEHQQLKELLNSGNNMQESQKHSEQKRSPTLPNSIYLKIENR